MTVAQFWIVSMSRSKAAAVAFAVVRFKGWLPGPDLPAPVFDAPSFWGEEDDSTTTLGGEDSRVEMLREDRWKRSGWS